MENQLTSLERKIDDLLASMDNSHDEGNAESAGKAPANEDGDSRQADGKSL